MVKFLIIRFSSIGDIVLTTPVIRCLKAQIPDVQIHYLTKKSFESILLPNPNVDKLHLLDDSLKTITDKLLTENFDYIIDLHHNLRSSIVKSRIKALSFSFDKLNFAKWLLVNFKLNILPDIHIVDRYMNTLRLFDISNDNKGLDFYINNADMVDLQSLPIKFQKGYIGFVIGAKHNTKKLPVSKIVSIIKLTGLPAILLGGKGDITEASYIQTQLGELCYNACGKFSLAQSASLVKQANVIITHDTGLMHIASAYKKKIISVWGNTVPRFGMYPYMPHPDSQIFEIKGLKCRPCSKIGYKKCPKEHFNCMNKIDCQGISDLAKKLF